MEDRFVLIDKVINVEDYYSAFDVFVLPSLFEGLPTVGIEAQCEGLPCYFSNTIDPQIMITDNSHLLPLNGDKKMWAKEISIGINYANRSKYSEEIKKHEYDNKDVSKVVIKLLSEI